YPAAAIQGNAAAGFSTGQANGSLERLCNRELPQSMDFEWSEIAYLERKAGNTGMIVFALSVAFVFLVLAALYESWSLPLAVILGVLPLGIAHGAGAEMRRALGTAVFSGMLGVTFFGIFLTPVFYYVIDRMTDWRMFSAGIMPRMGHVIIDTLQFGFIRRPA